MSVAKKTKNNITWTEGSGNVFADLELPGAEEKLAKAKLAFKLNQIIAQKGLKQSEAAKLLGVDQPKISLIHCGLLDDFSIWRLTNFLILLNQDVDILVKKSKSKSGLAKHGKLRVVYA